MGFEDCRCEPGEWLRRRLPAGRSGSSGRLAVLNFGPLLVTLLSWLPTVYLAAHTALHAWLNLDAWFYLKNQEARGHAHPMLLLMSVYCLQNRQTVWVMHLHRNQIFGLLNFLIPDDF